MPRVALMFALVATACRAAEQPPAPPPVVFEGFGLGDMSAAASVARALRGTAAVGVSARTGIIR